MCNFVQLKFFGVQDFCPGSVFFKTLCPDMAGQESFPLNSVVGISTGLSQQTNI